MSRVITNNVTLAYTLETSLGVLPGSPIWKYLEPNSITAFGAKITTVTREPISKLKQARKGIVSDLDSSVEFEIDLLIEPFADFIEGFVFSQFRGAAEEHPTAVVPNCAGTSLTVDVTTTGADHHVTALAIHSGGAGTGYKVGDRFLVNGGTATAHAVGKVTAVTAGVPTAIAIDYQGIYSVDPAGSAVSTTAALGGFVVSDSLGQLQAGTLIFSRGFVNTTNNGLLVVGANSTPNLIAVTGLVAETVGTTQNAFVDVCGFRPASGDLEIDTNGNLISSTLDFTTLKLFDGQTIWIGGADSTHNFATTADVGFVRIGAIATNLLTINKRSLPFTIDAGTSKTIDLYFGRFCANVASDDANFITKSYQFEAAYPDLDSVGVPMYEYAIGNYCSTIDFSLPITNKATIKFGFMGTDTTLPSDTRETNAANALTPVMKAAFSTSTDVARLRLQEADENGLSTYFKSLDLTITNNVKPEKTVGVLGATFMNAGNFGLSLKADLVFTNAAVVSAIKNNETLTMDFAVENGDGAIHIDIPSMTIGDGTKGFTMNESVSISLTGGAFLDSVLNTSIGVSLFPYMPV